MQSFTSRGRRAAVIAGVAGAAVVGAIGVGATAGAFAASTPTPSPSASGSTESDGGSGREDRVREPRIGGTVTSVDGSTVVVTDFQGFTRTIELQSGATVMENGAAAEASAIGEGDTIVASGAVATDGTTLDATAVRIGEFERGGPGGHGGRHGFGERPDRPDRPDRDSTETPGATPTPAPAS